MAFDDYLEPEVAVAAAAAAIVFSPRGRSVLRKGLVYGLAGVIAAGDALSTAGQTIGRSVQRATTSAAQSAKETMERSQMHPSAYQEEVHTSAATEQKV